MIYKKGDKKPTCELSRACGLFSAGIITRQETEDLLSKSSPGAFLIRVSERIFGYVLSCQSQDGIKHFLIDATDNCFMLLGDQIRFGSLGELVEYHKVIDY